jgi:tripartite-type tricarboxylate transporter receptor subunit TctC
MRIPVLIACVLASAAVCAQSYPTRTVRIVVPYAAGGNTDWAPAAMARFHHVSMSST